jgi:hypothetical protein
MGDAVLRAGFVTRANVGPDAYRDRTHIRDGLRDYANAVVEDGLLIESTRN